MVGRGQPRHRRQGQAQGERNRGHGVGQNLGNNVTVPYWSPKVVWSTGFQIFGANLSMAVEQPFYYTAAYPSNGATLGGNGSGPPFGNTSSTGAPFCFIFSAPWL